MKTKTFNFLEQSINSNRLVAENNFNDYLQFICDSIKKAFPLTTIEANIINDSVSITINTSKNNKQEVKKLMYTLTNTDFDYNSFITRLEK